MARTDDIETPAESSEEAEETGGISGARGLLRATGRLLRGNAWLLVLLVMGCAGLEAGLRVFQPQLAGLVYARDVTGGHPVVLTEKAFRIPPGPEPEAPPAVLAIGDSVTFGTGVAAGETWPLQLQEQLEAQLGGAVPVRNAGIEGSEPRQQLRALETIWGEPAPPEIVVLLVSANMISLTEFREGRRIPDPQARARALRAQSGADRGPKRMVSDMVQSSALWKAVSLGMDSLKYALGLQGHRVDPAAPLSPLLAYGWQQPDLPQGYKQEMWDAFDTAMADLDRQVRQMGACFVLGFVPPRFMLGDARRDNMKFVPKSRLTADAEARVAALADRLGSPFVSLGPTLAQARESAASARPPLYIPGDYTHLDATGHEVAATAIAEAVRPLLEEPESCGS